MWTSYCTNDIPCRCISLCLYDNHINLVPVPCLYDFNWCSYYVVWVVNIVLLLVNSVKTYTILQGSIVLRHSSDKGYAELLPLCKSYTEDVHQISLLLLLVSNWYTFFIPVIRITDPLCLSFKFCLGVHCLNAEISVQFARTYILSL